jgi:hypothetical protein
MHRYLFFTLLLGVFCLSGASAVSAETLPFSVTPQGLLTLQFESGVGESSAFHTRMVGMPALYPATTSATIGYGVSFGSNSIINTFCSALCTATTSNSLTYNLELANVSDGPYWFELRSGVTTGQEDGQGVIEAQWFQIYRNDGVWSGTSGIIETLDYSSFVNGGKYNTRFLELVSSSTNKGGGAIDLFFDIDYFIDINDVDHSNALRNLRGIRAEYILNSDSESARGFNIPIENGTSTFLFDTYDFKPDGKLDEGHYDWTISFSPLQLDQKYVFPRTKIFWSFDVSSGQIINATIPIVTNGILEVSQDDFLECSFTQIDDCMIIAIRALLIPSDDVQLVFYQSIDDIGKRLPFSYVTSFTNLVSDFEDTQAESPTITLNLLEQDISIIDTNSYTNFIGNPLFTFLYSLATGAIYIALAFSLWGLRKQLFR